MEIREQDCFTPASRQEWRQWLSENHDRQQSVWLVYYKNKPGMPTVTYTEAVDEALCFGWIDSTLKGLGNNAYAQFFTRRKAASVWSKINKGKVVGLIAEGLMAAPGLDSIAVAKQNGYWSILDDVEALVIPNDLAAAFRQHKGSKTYFTALSKSVKKQMLQWIVLAKQPQTRQKRIDEIARLAGHGTKPKQFL